MTVFELIETLAFAPRHYEVVYEETSGTTWTDSVTSVIIDHINQLVILK